MERNSQTYLASLPAVHQYACLRCRQRRVRCDKVLTGCANCANHGAQCVFSARRPRKLHKVLPEPGLPRPLLPAYQPAPPNGHRADSLGSDLVYEVVDSYEETRSDGEEEEDALIPRELREALEVKVDCTQADRGKLIVGPHGRSRYINSDKVNQVSYLETVLASNSDERDNATSSSPVLSSPDRPETLDAGSLLSAQGVKRSLRAYHPAPKVMHALWDYYTRHIDIMVKVVYKPEVKDHVMNASRDLSDVDSSTETLLFALWFAATACMSPEECLQIHGEERPPLLRKYRSALEQALVQAGWITTQELLVLQSLCLYLPFASDHSRSTWMLCGIAISLAQAMGLHTDGSSFSLNAFETEVRRRVWWTLCQIDVRVSENCGLQSHVPLIMTTELPLHINDSDLEDSHESVLRSRTEFTEMTIPLVKIEMAHANLRFKRSPTGTPASSDLERDSIIQNQLKRYEDVYLKYLDGSSEFQRLSHFGIKLIMARLWKLKYDASNAKPHRVDTDELDEALLLWNADVLETAHQLPPRCRRYGWFFRCRYTQWHAMAYLLIQLCKHTQGPAVDRAWAVLDAVFGNADDVASVSTSGITGMNVVPKKNVLWQPLLKLLGRARNTRRQAQKTPPDSTGTPSSLDSTNEIQTHTPIEQPVHSSQPQDALLGDPFFGQALDFGEEMNWEQLDTWVQYFQTGLYQDDGADYQGKDAMGALNWW